MTHNDIGRIMFSRLRDDRCVDDFDDGIVG